MPDTDADLIHIADHGEVGVGRLPSRFRRPNIETLIRSLATGVQLAEDLNWYLLNDGLLDNATGAALDQWGELVGEQRLGLGDSDYRRFISARMLVNLANPGTPNELLAIWSLITAPHEGVRYRSPAGAIVWLTVVRQTPLAPGVVSRVVRMMEQAKPAARLLRLIEAPVGYFGLDPDPDALGYDAGRFARLLE